MTSERTSKGQLLTIVIGANGAGKTTWVRKHRALLPERFYNADSIAEGLGDANSAERQSEARQIVDRAIQQDMNHERAFGFESTYSGRSRPEIVKQARRAGYTVNALFIGTERHEINAARVAKRAEEGGHDIAYQEVVRRWAAVQENLIGPGGRGQLPTRGSHGSGRAPFGHPAPQIMVSLLNGTHCARRAQGGGDRC